MAENLGHKVKRQNGWEKKYLQHIRPSMSGRQKLLQISKKETQGTKGTLTKNLNWEQFCSTSFKLTSSPKSKTGTMKCLFPPFQLARFLGVK